MNKMESKESSQTAALFALYFVHVSLFLVKMLGVWSLPPRAAVFVFVVFLFVLSLDCISVFMSRAACGDMGEV